MGNGKLELGAKQVSTWLVGFMYSNVFGQFKHILKHLFKQTMAHLPLVIAYNTD
jgi:hypothetical protein